MQEQYPRTTPENCAPTNSLYAGNLKMQPVAPWQNTPAQAAYLGIPINQLATVGSLATPPAGQHSEYTPTRPLQVRVKLARNSEDECLTVAQMSKNLASQQRVSDAPRPSSRKANIQQQDTDFSADRSDPKHRAPRARSKSRTRAEASTLDEDHPPVQRQTPDTETQQQIAELKKKIDMHAAVLADHRDAIRKTNTSMQDHAVVMLNHGTKLNKLQQQHTDFRQAHTSMSSEIDRIKATFSTKTRATPDPKADTYTNFKTLQSRYNA